MSTTSKLLFFRSTHDETGEAKPLTPEQEAVWNSKIHAGGFVAHMLDPVHGMALFKLLEEVWSYEDLHHEGKYYTIDEVLSALFELARVGLVRYEIHFQAMQTV